MNTINQGKRDNFIENTIAVSVIIPIFNVEEYIAKCLDSVLRQSLKEIEVICIDDASTDGSMEVLLKYKKSDSRVRVIQNEENLGLSLTRNKGMNNALGEYIWFVDSDDALADMNALRYLYLQATKEFLDIAILDFNYRFEDEELEKKYGKFIRNKSIDYMETICGQEMFCRQISNGDFYTPACSYFYRLDFLKENSLTFAKIIHEDDLFSVEAMLWAKRVKYFPKEYYQYYRRNGSLSTSTNYSRHLASYMYIFDQLLKDINKWDLNVRTERAIARYMRVVKTNILFYYLEMLKNQENPCFYLSSHAVLFYFLLEEKYPFISSRLNSDLYVQLCKFKKRIVYGAGVVSCSVKKFLEDVGISEYVVAVTAGAKDGIYNLKELQGDATDSLLLISVTHEKQKEMKEYATQLGFNNLYFMV